MSDKVIPLYAEAPAEPLYNVEAEMGLLGAILENNRAYDKVCDFLRPEHFYDKLHQSIFAACARLIEAGKQASPTTLKHVFDAGEFAAIGGHRYLAELAAASMGTFGAYDYGRLIHSLHGLRSFREIGGDMLQASRLPDPDIDVSGLVESVEHALYRIVEGHAESRGFRRVGDVLPAVLAHAQSAFDGTARTGISTGIAALDTRLGGMKDSDLIVIAARPSMGKTALATNIAWSVASATAVNEDGEIVHPDSVGFFSLEMSEEQLAHRILADRAGIPSDRILKGAVNATEFARLKEASRDMESVRLHIDDTPNLTVAALKTRARRLKREKGLSLLVVDYIQLMAADGYQNNKVQQVSEITRGLKVIAKELNVPVIALSQLSRAVEQRDNKRPQLSDLRDSGSIEQDADVVMFIYREEYYLAREEPADVSKMADWQVEMRNAQGRAEIIIAKQRHGPIGTAHVGFDAATTRFRDLAEGCDHG